MSGNEAILFDRQVLDELRAALGDKVNHIVQVYIEDVPQSIEAMRHALTELEYEALGRFAHSLKSSSANLGAMQTSALAASLEKLMKENSRDELAISKAIEQIEKSFIQTRTMFINYIG